MKNPLLILVLIVAILLAKFFHKKQEKPVVVQPTKVMTEEVSRQINFIFNAIRELSSRTEELEKKSNWLFLEVRFDGISFGDLYEKDLEEKRRKE